MIEEIFVKRESTDVPFGFKIAGGADFSAGLHVLQVTPNSIADRAGLRQGDGIVKINAVETNWMDHTRAKQELIRSGNDFKLTVVRNAVDTTKPECTPLSQLRTNQPQSKDFYTTPPELPKTCLSVEKPESINIGTSHNRAPMPFNAGVGTTIDYKSAKPTNWAPGDYTKWSSLASEQAAASVQPAQQYQQQQPNSPKMVTAVFHNQYNSPLGIYSDSNVLQEFHNQTKGVLPSPRGPQHQQPHQQPNQQQQQQPNYFEKLQQPGPKLPRGCNSLSMHMLGKGIDDASIKQQQPPSVFDLKSGENPTGATVPRGFRSVQPPNVPAEQRHAPMRKEYQVQHVQQSWIEPKL